MTADQLPGYIQATKEGTVVWNSRNNTSPTVAAQDPVTAALLLTLVLEQQKTNTLLIEIRDEVSNGALTASHILDRMPVIFP